MTDDIYSDEWIARANEELHTIKGCPRCGSKEATVIRHMEPKPVGTFSLSGYQDKLSCTAILLLECPDCELKATLLRKNDDD